MSLDGTRVCAVTVTYGSRLDLCRRTVQCAFSSGVDHAIVVDNGSDVGHLLMAEFQDESRVSIIRTGRNLGSAGGFAAGIEASVLRHEEYVLLLDDDNLLGPESLSRAVRFHGELMRTLDDERLVVACMRTSNPLHQKVAQGRAAHRVYPPPGSFISLDILQRLTRKLQGLSNSPDAQETDLPVIPVAPYGGLLLRRQELERHGGPNPLLMLYEDDTAWTHALSRRGCRIVLCIDAPIQDADAKWLDSGTRALGPLRMLRAGDTARLYYSVRNRVLFDFGRAEAPRERLRYYLNRTVFFLYVRFAGRGTSLAAARKTFFTAVKHGEKARLGLGPPL